MLPKARGSRPGFENLPNATFRFVGADMVVHPPSAFWVGVNQRRVEYFCLAMLPSLDAESISAIGVYQPTKHRVPYNLNRSMLRFNPKINALEIHEKYFPVPNAHKEYYQIRNK